MNKLDLEVMAMNMGTVLAPRFYEHPQEIIRCTELMEYHFPKLQEATDRYGEENPNLLMIVAGDCKLMVENLKTMRSARDEVQEKGYCYKVEEVGAAFGLLLKAHVTYNSDSIEVLLGIPKEVVDELAD